MSESAADSFVQTAYRSIARPVVLLAAFIGSGTPPPLRAQPASPPAVARDWSRIVPGDARFYVELRDLAEIRAIWQRIGIWQTVRELTDHGANPAGRPWQQRAEELLGLGAEDAISQLLGHRSALIASESSQWNGGVVLAELENAPDLAPLLKRWSAKQLADEGPVKRYQLGGGILLAVLDRTLVLGPADDPDGLWGRTVLLLAGRRGPSLAARSDFGALRSRLSAPPQGLLYSAWRRDDPLAFEGCTRLLAAARVTESEIQCDIHGQRSNPRLDETVLSKSDLAALPADTLAVWAGSVDFKDVARRNAEGRFGSAESFAGILIDALTVSRTGAENLVDQLGPKVRFVLAPDPAAQGSGMDLPAMTVLIQSTEKENTFVGLLDGLFFILTNIIGSQGAPSDPPAAEVAVKKTPCEGVDLHSIEAGPALARRLKLDFLNKVEFAWARLDDALLLSTSRAHAEKIIRAAHGKGPRLDDMPDAGGIFPSSDEHGDLAECFHLRGSRLSSMLSNWLEYLGKHQPQALRPRWWQNWAGARVHQRDKLGVALQADPHHPDRAVVLEMEDGSPAAGLLEIGDVVTGAAGSPIDSKEPAQEVARRYQARGDRTVFVVDVIRGQKTIRVEIPVPPAPTMGAAEFDPIRAIRQIAVLSRRADMVTVWRFASHKDRLDARVRIRWLEPGH